MAKQPKLTVVKLHVGKEVDIQKVVGQIHTLVSKSRMIDRVTIEVNGEAQAAAAAAAPAEDDGAGLL